MSEPTPEQPEEPKRRDLTRAFSAVVRPPGEKKSLSSYLVTIGMTVVLAGAVALGVGAIVFRPHAKEKPVAAADKQHSKTASPAASPRIVYRQPPASGANPPAVGAPPGKHQKSPKGGSSSSGRASSGSTGSGSTGGATQSQAKVMTATPTNFLLGNASHRCIDVAGGRAVNNNYTQIWDCRSGLPQQQWSFVNGTMRSMGMCLTTTGSSAGSALVIQSCNGGSAQLFRHTSANDIVHSGTNKCVDARGDKTAAGTRLQIYTCNGYNNQKWHLT